MDSNLLVDPVFRALAPDGEVRLSLPGLLEALGVDRIDALPGLQRHQEDAFHIFLCYLAGAVLAREGRDAPAQAAAFWRDSLGRLAGRDDDCAWTLVVADVTRPAFMQAPLPDEAALESFKPKVATPDALDVLQTAKNHDLKAARGGGADAEATWSSTCRCWFPT